MPAYQPSIRISTCNATALTKAGCHRIFEEKKSGRAGSKRPELDAALAFLRPKDVLVVWKLDRLGRSLVEMMRTIDGLRRDGVRFHSLTEGFDSESPHGRFALRCTAPWLSTFSTSTASAQWRASRPRWLEAARAVARAR